MLAIQVTLNVFIIAGLLASSFIIGFLLRGSRVVSLRNKVAELEKEILTSHAEILQVQREKNRTDAVIEHSTNTRHSSQSI